MLDYIWRIVGKNRICCDWFAGKHYYTKQSLEQTLENVKNNRHEYKTEQAFSDNVARLTEGLRILNSHEKD